MACSLVEILHALEFRLAGTVAYQVEQSPGGNQLAVLGSLGVRAASLVPSWVEGSQEALGAYLQ